MAEYEEQLVNNAMVDDYLDPMFMQHPTPTQPDEDLSINQGNIPGVLVLTKSM